jgi:hypothetical protein
MYFDFFVSTQYICFSYQPPEFNSCFYITFTHNYLIHLNNCGFVVEYNKLINEHEILGF